MRSTVRADKKPTVLIAEDDEMIGRIVSDALNGAGFKSRLVDDGVDAINEILEMKPDMIVLDLILPRLRGSEICAMVRKSAQAHHTPILVISGCSTLESKLQTFDLGADDYVTKPFDISELIARVDALWNRAQRRNYSLPFARI